MLTTIIVNGANGKMGSLTADIIRKTTHLKLLAALDKQDNLDTALKDLKPDIAIDFTEASTAATNTKIIIDNNIRPIIGTSGLQLDEIRTFQQTCKNKKLGGIIVPNFSLGAVLMMKYAKDAATYFEEVEIIEAHHNQKTDAPSGTAKKTAQLIKAARTNQPHIVCANADARGDQTDGVPIHSLRLPGFVASQKVIFGTKGETLTIENHCIDRSAYMAGVLLACRKVADLQHLAYGLEEIL